MSDFQKDILTGAVFVAGVLGFVSGEFILSSTLFATAAIAGNINATHKRNKSERL